METGGIVYEIRCNMTDRVYIGSTTQDINTRIMYHLHPSNQTTSRSILDDKNWTHKILETVVDATTLLKREAYHMKVATGIIVNRRDADKPEVAWHEKNKAYVRKKRQERWAREKEQESQPIQCECGATIKGERHRNAHLKTKKHEKYMSMTPEEKLAYENDPTRLYMKEYARKLYEKTKAEDPAYYKLKQQARRAKKSKDSLV